MKLEKELIEFIVANFKAWKDAPDKTKKLAAGEVKLNAEWCGKIIVMAADQNADKIIEQLLAYAKSIGIPVQDFINARDNYTSRNTAIIRAAAKGHIIKAFLIIDKTAKEIGDSIFPLPTELARLIVEYTYPSYQELNSTAVVKHN